MKILKRSVESSQFKHKLNRFYRVKVKPILLSFKHFFKSSHKFFMQHPRLRMCSIVGGVFLTLIVISAVANTFSKNVLTNNIDYARFDKYVDEFWHNLSRNVSVSNDEDGNEIVNKGYSRSSESISYKTIADTTGTCNINIATLTYDHNLTVPNDCYMEGNGTADSPYLVTTIQQFMFARNLGKTDSNGKYFKLMENLDFTGFALPVYDNSSKSGLFSGNFDGNFKHIKGLTYANTTNKVLETIGLFPAIEGNSSTPAVVKNFILDDATFSISGNYNKGITAFGALVGLVGPYSYVYNNGLLSGTITASGLTGATSLKDGVYIGSLYGFYTDFEYNDTYKTNRQYNSLGNTKGGIFNSYSYANMNISGTQSGTVKFGGVLGYRLKDVKAIDNDNSSYFMNGKNSLFILNNYYGKITVSGNADYQFVYNGAHAISSSISPHFSYYWFKGGTRDITTDRQSYAIAQDSDYLQSKGFVANLNSYRDVMNFYFRDTWGSNSPVTAALSSDFAQTEWYISNSDFGAIRPYFPILRKKVDGREHSSNTDGTIRVTFQANGFGTTSQSNVTITNQDEMIDDYVYHKIELPFAKDALGTNKGHSGSYDMTFNGWRLVSVNGSSVTASPESMQFNMTLRTGGNGKAKDVNNVYAEGGYYLVPDGVTEVVFQAVWAYTIYVADAYNQATFNAVNYGYRADSGFGNTYNNHTGLSETAPVTDMGTAYNLANGTPNHSDVYSTVIMLVGNYHYSPNQANSSTINCDWFKPNENTQNRPPVTIKSIDKDGDKKPDYSLYIRNLTKMNWGSVRFDFINVLGIPQVAGYSGMLGAFYLAANSTFIVTETVVTDHITLFMQNASKVHILGGYYDIYNNVDTQTDVNNAYMIFGGTARTGDLIATSTFDTDQADATVQKGRVINIIGGIAKTVSNDNRNTKLWVGNINYYIDGGYINELYASFLGDSQGMVYATVNNSYINECYGGGYGDTSHVKKGVVFTIDNARIGKIFGGPKYGVVESSINMTITNSIMDNVYGGGYGGTEYFTAAPTRYVDKSGSKYNITNSWSTYQFYTFSGDGFFKAVNYKAKKYSYNGVTHTAIEDIVAYLSMSSSPKINFSISDSFVTANIYGGGNRGVVSDNIRIELHNVDVRNVFGAGVSNAQDTVEVNEENSITEPPFYNYAIDTEYYNTNTTTYTWKYDSAYANSGSKNSITIDTSAKTIQTATNKELGLVEAGDIFINISGDSHGKYPMRVRQDVYGGGDRSNVVLSGEIHLNINDGVTIGGSVYGGGNLHDVNANTNVIVENQDMNNRTRINGGVYAAGNSANVNGNATVTISGNPIINNVFGGGNKSSATESNVYIEGGEIENVFGGSNNSGTINTTNVYIAKKSPKGKTNGYTEEFNFCTNRAFDFDIINNNSSNEPTGFQFKNLTNINFTEYTFSIQISAANIAQIGNNTPSGWSNGTNKTSYANGVITINHNHKDYGTVSFNSGQTIRGDIRIQNVTHINYQVVGISFIGYDGDGNAYSFDNCAASYLTDNTIPVTVQNAEPVYTQTKLGNVNVANIFGGNNVGGKSLNTNVLVLGNGTNSEGTPYTVEVGNVYGGGSATPTGNSTANTARVVINGAHVTGSVYGGGRGIETDILSQTPATMYARPYVLIANGAQIDKSVFGGGFAIDSDVGDASNPNETTVYLNNCTINENVYGGGYGDKIYGKAVVYTNFVNNYNTEAEVRNVFGIDNNRSIFYHTPLSSASNKGHNIIKGSVYGGSETGKKNGSFDFQTVSVTDGISVYVEDNNKCDVRIDGSIFGSGNYSRSNGYSEVMILNWGTRNDPKRIASIQRAANVYINNSSIKLSGASDVTNKFSSVLYSFNAIDDLKIGSASTIYTSAQTNLLKSWSSYNGQSAFHDSRTGTNLGGTLATVDVGNKSNTITVDGDEKVIVNKVNGNNSSASANRLYLLNNRGMNILTYEEIGDGFGNVYGMTFLGVYTEDNSGNISTTYYNQSYDLKPNTSVSGITKTDFNAYVLGGNRTDNEEDMNYFEHGFFTNTYYDNDGADTPTVKTTVINPTPQKQAYYYWNIGVPSIIMEVNLTASKYVRSGMKSVSMYQFSGYDRVTFDISGMDSSGLTTEADFINPDLVPSIATSSEEALKTFGLGLETSDVGWVNEGHTYLDSSYNSGNRTENIMGTIKYDTSGSEDIPKFVFNFENSRNIKNNTNLGTVVVTINAHAFTEADPINPVNSVIKLYVNLDTHDYADDDYESAMAPGKHYKSFLSSKTNITATSELSAYFNLYAYDKNLYQTYREDPKMHDATVEHVLYTSYVLPAGTRITMLDLSTDDPKYYYYDVTGSETLVRDKHTMLDGSEFMVYGYPLAWFTSMDSTSANNKYDEEINQARYVAADGNTYSTVEQFIFMVDFNNVTNHTKPLSQIRNEELFLGIRVSDDGSSDIWTEPMYETARDMAFSIFESNDATFDLNLQNTPDEDSTIYVDDVFTFKADVTVHDTPITDPVLGVVSVRNTNYYQDRLGLRIGLYHITEDEHGNERSVLVSGDELSGAVFYVNGVGYAPGSNGFVRLKLADYVVKINEEIKVDLTNAEHLTSGLYEFRVTALASADGLYAKQGDAITNSVDTFRVNLVNENYGLLSTIDDDKDVIVYSDGKTSGGTDKIEVTMNYFGSYQNPNIKISLKRRDYSTVSNNDYNDVNIADYFDVSSTTFTDTSQLDRTDLFNTSTLTINKNALLNHINSGNMGIYKLSFKLKNTGNLPTGTYRIAFTLYNGDKEIGDVYSYIIIKD